MSEKVWHKNYQEGVPKEIDPNQYKSIVEVLENGFKNFSNKPAFSCMGKTLSFAQIDHLSKKMASFYQNTLGLKKGDRVAIMMPNILQYPIALFGALRAGLTAVNVNPLYTARELKHQLNDSGAKVIVIFANSAHLLQKVLPETPVEHIVLTQIGDMLGLPKSIIVNSVIKYVKKMVPDFHLPQAYQFNTVLGKANANSYRRVELNHDDIAFLQYTGGTTGVSKGAVLSHGNIVSNILQAHAWLKPIIGQKDEIIITPLPLYHIFSLTANCFIFSSIGAHNILITNPRDLDGFIKELKKWPFTAFTGVNTLFNGLINHPEFKNIDFSSLHVTLGGGMAVQRPVAEKWRELTGVPLIEAYGLTETSPAACINPLDLDEFNGCIGIPIPSTEVEIRDEEGKTLGFGEVGEICIRGPQVMQGYFNRDEETQKVMWPDQFFRTGDMGHMNENGFIKLVDRKKDMILVSGFNVYPNEIEEVLCTHPKVLECAAIGVEDAKSGEAVKVFIVKKDVSLTENEVKDFAKDNLTGYKKPKFVEFRENLPKTNVGKILRRELRN